VRACALLDSEGRLVSVNAAHAADGEALGELATQLLDCASTHQIEVSTGIGIVFALRSGDWTLAVVAGRFALSSLVFFDMRQTLAELA
jgi:predicted regulator of Ras-like GTPase activity (Roadblock/LC7/MglB family)